ncbi:MAG: hypothetical protein ACTSWQ_02280 [Candidatus Thorarchaeota archaeon]
MSPQSQPDITRMQSSVPLFSGASYQGFYIGGLLWGFTFKILLIVFEINLDILQWLLVTLLVGLVMQCLIYGWKRQRFRNPVDNPELLALFEEVKYKLGKGQNIELWFRGIDRGIFLSSVNPLFQAILLSESTIADILDNGENGKTVLAREVLLMERTRPLIRMVVGLLGFTFFSFIQNMMSFSNVFGIIFYSMTPLVLAIGIIAILVIIVLVIRILSRGNDDIDKTVEDIFGLRPDAAFVEVMGGFKVPEEVIEKIRRDEEEGKASPMKKAVRIAAPVAVITSFIVFIIMMIIFPNPPFFPIFTTLISALAAFVAFMITLVTSAMWPILRPSGKRTTEWDIQVPFAAEVQRFLNEFLGSDNISVRGIKPPSDELYGLIVLGLDKNYEEKVLYGMLPHILKDIHDVNLVGPFILSEIRRKEIEKRYNRISYVLLGILIPFMFISMFLPIVLFGFGAFFNIILPIFGMSMFIVFLPIAYMSNWKKKAEIESDSEIATSCHRFREALQTLIDKHHTLPYGETSYRTRLERIDKHLGILQEDRVGI